MNKKDKLWIKSMEFFFKYWGCHQIPERSFYFKNYQFPVCARCTGLIIGELSALILTYFLHIPNYILFIFLIPMIADGLIQLKTQYESNNLKRFITGILFGYSIAALIVNTIKSIII